MNKAIFCSGVRVNEVSLRYNRPKKRILPKITKEEEAFTLLRQCFEPDRIALKEFFFALYLSRSNEALAISCISVGGETSTIVSTKEIVSNALLLNGLGVIVAHNHPSGSVQFSARDRKITKRLKDALKLFDISLIDHVLFTKDTALSLRSTEPNLF